MMIDSQELIDKNYTQAPFRSYYSAIKSPEIFGALAQLARAPPLQGGGQGFEFLRLHFDLATRIAQLVRAHP